MHEVILAWARALRAQFHGRILLLGFLPFAAALVLWGVVLWLGMQPLIDAIQSAFVAHDGFGTSSSVLSRFGLGMAKTVVVPLMAMLLLMPLMVVSAMLFIGAFAMPALVRHVSARHYPSLELRRGGSFFGSMGNAMLSTLVFLIVWIVCLPIIFLPPLALIVHVVLWGWLSMRVFAYDALAEHADAEERVAIMRRLRLPLLAIGIVSGATGALPGLVWMGGTVMSVVLFPFLAVASIWLYVMIFIFTGLWFTHFSLQALSHQRAGETLKA